MTIIRPITQALPRSLSFDQFIQTLLVGLSGLPGELVRPKWQPEPPKTPDLATGWLAFGIENIVPDANAWVGQTVAGKTQLQRHESLELTCSVYGPNAVDLYGLVRDGFQITQNLDAIFAASIGFIEVGQGHRVPDLINERWINRVAFSIYLRRQILRTYPITSFTSASGTIHTILGDEEYLKNWNASAI